ncbi:tetratricopeptide repeat protein [Hydrogenophaga sp.]|uniref:tetratricopeptide repeat protein n=1 Tax=Hydrogenophaga sp. TaxID=1904254 RepID=UPI00272EFAA7|nr:tetratricopeptide repeat protein [Hydrogenophaga sp.]MDP2016757.1 tetratricopeptide repeat protein [Hydrogenophaga sp.]MDP3165488.1 tetratricopeptide repeat protein [Hydrogenophaga sp.]MDP3812071.1 tetratricopeptide repeat protein [Hydrogenophaga sp.]
MKHMVMTGLLVAICTASMVWAEDTPSNMASGAQEHMVTARAALAAKDWRTAIAELNAVVKFEPRNADAHNLLGYSHRKQTQPDLAKAFEHYKRALQIDPRHKGAHEYIGEAYLMDKRLAEAEKHLAELARICGNQTCEEYADLARAITAYKAKAPG